MPIIAPGEVLDQGTPVFLQVSYFVSVHPVPCFSRRVFSQQLDRVGDYRKDNFQVLDGGFGAAGQVHDQGPLADSGNSP
jgi:hypothetical protein